MKENFLNKLITNAEASRPATDGGFILTGPTVTVNLPGAPKRYLYHGWQSWSLTAWAETSRPMPIMRPAIMHPMQTDPVYIHKKHPNGAWYGAVEMENEQIVFIGALALEAHVALDDTSLKGWYEDMGRDGIASYEWFVATGDESEVMARYAELLGERFGKGRPRKAYRVWCSWYSLYTEIYEEQLLKVLNDLGTFDDAQGLPFEVFQIDDGWQKGIGNWVPNAKFPSGMDHMATQIKASGRIPGLWLAPLLVVPSSSVYRDHRDWLLHDEKGRLVSAGFNWSEQLYALDTTHPGALDWLAALMKKVRAWGYDYAKLDFLYAGALPGKRYSRMPRETAYRHGLKVIREALGEAYFLTCGAPILPSLGLCDGMRVGPDVANYWENPRDRDLLVNFAAPGTRNAIRTTLNRLWLQPLVHTDPDVVYFRSRQNALTQEQKTLLQDLAQAAGFKATSDVPAWLTEAERIVLREYLKTSPQVKKTGKYKHQIGEREVDFSPFIGMPPPPGFPRNVWGALIGRLANVPTLLKIFDAINRKSLENVLKKNPI